MDHFINPGHSSYYLTLIKDDISSQYLEGGSCAGGCPDDGFLSDVVAETRLGGNSAGVDVGEEEGGSGGGPRPPLSGFRSVAEVLAEVLAGALASGKI